MTSANDLLFSGGLPSISFKDKPIGHEYRFTIVKINEPRQQTDIVSGAPQAWDDGRPKMTVPVDVRLAPGSFTPDSSTDQGDRSWWIPVGSQMHSATRDAVRQAGAAGLENGAFVIVTLSGVEPAKQKGLNDKKIYAVEYKAPSAGSDAVMSGGATAESVAHTPAVAPPTPVATPPAPPQTDQAALAAALGNLTPEQRKALGLPDF